MFLYLKLTQTGVQSSLFGAHSELVFLYLKLTRIPQLYLSLELTLLEARPCASIWSSLMDLVFLYLELTSMAHRPSFCLGLLHNTFDLVSLAIWSSFHIATQFGTSFHA